MLRTSFAGFGEEHYMGVHRHVLKGKADSLQTKTNIESGTHCSPPSTAKQKIPDGSEQEITMAA